MKTLRWRAVNKASNRDEYKLAIKEAIRRKEAFIKGDAILKTVVLEAVDGERPLTISYVE